MSHRLWKLTQLGVVAVFALVGSVACHRGGEPDDPTASPPLGAEPEPITGSPSTPEAGDETGPIHPFAAPPAGNVPISALSPAAQAYVTAGRDLSGWETIHARFAAASRHAATRAHAQAAANALGLEGLGNTGVVEP
jgi:hypothetical protein